MILKNPVYCGKIAYDRRKTEKVYGTRNDYHLVAQAKKYEHVNKASDIKTHLCFWGSETESIGYGFKNDVKQLDEEEHFRLGKYKQRG